MVEEGPLAFVDDLDAPVLTADDRHHLERVLRLARGTTMAISDGDGRWRRCRFGPDLEPLGSIAVVPAPSPPLTVAFALIKGERPELVVQKLTELGIDRIVPFTASRSVVRWEAARAAKHTERLRAVSRAAAMQCLRTRLPEIGELATFAQVSALDGAVLADRSGRPPSIERPVVLVGPEGGWSDEERAAPLPTACFGAQVLRAETAAFAAAALMAALRDGLVLGNHAP
jgi:16S rRNA (uracil1498-N3)-methyltransferase